MNTYYGVIYLTAGCTVISKPCQSEKECVEAMEAFVASNFNKVKATTFTVRKGEPVEFLLGHPKKRDLKQNKKFIKEITK